jgi:PST family polysaccharide transporter
MDFISTTATLNSASPPAVGLDRERHFRTDHLKQDLGRRSARATAFTAGAQAASLVLRMAATVVLARLLTPEDYGLFGMVTVLVSFISLFNDFGLSMATIQKEDVTHAEASTLFWVNVGVSSALALVLIALSPVVVWFYHEPRLLWLNVVLALSLLPGGLRVQHGAILRRQMRFGVIALVDLTALVVGIAAGIILAWLRRDYWGLVAMHWGTSVAACIGTWLVCGWIPSLPGRLAAVRSQLHFGTRFTGSQILVFLSKNLDNVMVGKFAGVIQLGLYDRAFRLMLQPMQQIMMPISNVATPTLSRLQSDPARLRKYFCAALSAICYLAMPLTMSLVVLSEEVTLLLLGPNWQEVSRIFRILALAALVEPVSSCAGWLMLSLGHTGRMLRWDIVQCPIVIAAFAIGLPWGAMGVATAYTCATFVLVPATCLYYLRDCPVTTRDTMGAVRRPALISILLAAVMFPTLFWLRGEHLLARLIATEGVGLAVFITIVLLWPAARADFVRVLHGLGSILRRQSGTAVTTASRST